MAADLLSDVLLHPRFDAGDIEREKAVVFQEMKMVDDTPDDLVHDLFAEKAWPGHPLGRPILGRREVVEKLDRETILGHFRGEYTPTRVTVAVAGNAEHDRVVEAFAGRFESFRGPALTHVEVAPVLSARRAPDLQAPRAGAGGHGLSGDIRSLPGALRALSHERHHGRQHVLPDLPGGAGAAGPRLLRPFRRPAIPRQRRALPVRGHGDGQLRQGPQGLHQGSARRSGRTASPPRSWGGPRTTSRAASCCRSSRPPRG